jgi:hypothetical protein
MSRIDPETDRLVRDKIKLSWLNLNAREVSIQPLNGSGVSLKFREHSFEGRDLSECLDQALETLDGKVQSRFSTSLDTTSHQAQSGVPTAGAGS